MVRVGKLSRYRTIGRSVGAVSIILSIGLLASCNSVTTGSTTDGAQIDVLDKVRSLDLLPRQPQPANAATSGSGQGGSSRPAMYEGAEVTTVSDERPQPSTSGNGFDLNFENSPIATVAKVVLGDILGVGYTIDPRVQGTVSLVSVRPVAKSDIIFVLENALRLSGVVLVRDTAGYRLTPLGDAVGAGRVDAAGASPEPGYGVSVVPLQYVSAQTLLKLMDSFATKAGAVRADATRNLLLIQGTGAERRTAVDTALSASTSTGCAVNRSGFFRSRAARRRRSSRNWKRSWIPAKTVSARTSSSFSRSSASTPSWSSARSRRCCARRRPGSSGSIVPTPREPAFTSIG